MIEWKKKKKKISFRLRIFPFESCYVDVDASLRNLKFRSRLMGVCFLNEVENFCWKVFENV